ncbi:MAG: serine/threonine protein kinase [Polyangiaceae bacterium]|nr:serine/threonine protein kinase [Myxococcales bacterium]MCB9589236.1 serine/threonine protein kinase [Polyangiaceae bacterium]
MNEPNSTLRRGSRLGCYRIEEVLGAGASGAVYVAECVEESEAGAETSPVKLPGETLPGPRVGQRVALKVLHRHLVKNYQISKRFAREARILSRLEGEHLVRLLDFGEADGQLYMALELVSGTALDVLMQGVRLRVHDAVKILTEICTALEVAHGSGVVHRDLKPGNVILEGVDSESEAFDSGRVRVLDFGMAKLIHGSSSVSMTALTEQNMVFGTPEYMAPEQARGDEVDARSDIYSAGVLLYELISGKLPFRGNTPIGIMTAHLTEEPVPPSSHAPDRKIPPAIESVVLHAMAKEPAARYPSARHLREALQQALESPEDIHSIAPPSSDDLSLTDTQHDMKLPDGLGRTEVDMVAVTLDARPAQAEQGSSKVWLLVAIIAALVGIAAGVAVSLGTS